MSISTQEAGADTTAAPPQVMPTAPTRRRKKGKTLPHLDRCLNCGRPTGETDNFCPNCGQENEDETVPLTPLVADALSEIVSWDSKLARTLLPLLFRPGFLTNEFLAGRRVRYLSPLKMYLVISAIFFLVLPTSHIAQRMHLASVSLQPTLTKSADTGPKPSIVAGPVSIHVSDDKPGPTDFPEVQQGFERLPVTVAAYDARQRVSPHRDGFWKSLMLRQIIKARHDKQTFAQSVFEGLIEALPKMMFALLPVFALLLKITYWRRRRLYIEHLIFALHSHAFAFTLLTLAVLASTHWPGHGDATWGAFFLLLSGYLYAAMRRVYKQGWWKTGFKFLWLSYNYVCLLAVAFALTSIVAFLLA